MKAQANYFRESESYTRIASPIISKSTSNDYQRTPEQTSTSNDDFSQPLRPRTRRVAPALPALILQDILPSPPLTTRSPMAASLSARGSFTFSSTSSNNSSFRCSSPTDKGLLRFQSPNDILKNKLRQQGAVTVNTYFRGLDSRSFDVV